jgi:two-component system CAI-1 autoinducer sensor kinase/phosphatase CqsS
MGFGLPFCKRVMNAFGGDISVKSVVGEGAEFCLRF